MEKQKLVYEERALVALQKVTQEKTEALIKSETMQVKYLDFNPNKQHLYLTMLKDTVVDLLFFAIRKH